MLIFVMVWNVFSVFGRMCKRMKYLINGFGLIGKDVVICMVNRVLFMVGNKRLWVLVVMVMVVKFWGFIKFLVLINMFIFICSFGLKEKKDLYVLMFLCLLCIMNFLEYSILNGDF